MPPCGTPAPELFQEAINHCRWTTVLRHELPALRTRLPTFKGKTFDETFLSVYTAFEPIKGLGLLSMYDVTAAICRYHSIPVSKVFLIGNGPKRAAKLLGLRVQRHVLKQGIALRYATIEDVRDALQRYGVSVPPFNPADGDALESFLCNWQKGV